MRTLDPALEAALNAGLEPYIQLQYCIDDGFIWLNAPNPMYSYQLGNLEFICETVAPTSSFPWFAIRLKRGCYINHVPNYVISSTYYVNQTFITQKTHVQVEASIIPKGTWKKYYTDGHQSYITIINAICSEFGYTAAYEDPTAAFWDNIFYPAGRTLVVQSPHSIFTLLRQKMFIYATDNNDNEIYFRQWLDDQLVGTGGHPSLETLTTFDWRKEYSLCYRLLMWRDESASIHYYPNPVFFPDLPVYNLGYIESTAETPTQWQSWHLNQDKRSFHLKYQDGDIIHCSSGTYQIQSFEIFNRKYSPSLYLQFQALSKFTATEGGPLPSTILAAAPYTPLNVSNFSGILDMHDNNLQAAMETLDDHDHGRETLLANRTYYVRTDGNDSNSGLVDSASGAFLTIQKAIDVAASLDTSIYNITIQLSDGTYYEANVLEFKNILGAGTLTITGNVAHPENVVIDNGVRKYGPGTICSLTNLKLSKTTSTSWVAIRVDSGATIYYSNIILGSGYDCHIDCEGGFIKATGDFTIAGSTSWVCIACYYAGLVNFYQRTITITGTPNLTVFAWISENSVLEAGQTTFVGSATGQRFHVDLNGVIMVQGDGFTHLPGNVAGTIESGGVYSDPLPTAYTQTYSTASKTVPNGTASDPPAGGTGATAGAYDTAAHRNAMITSLTNCIADVTALKKVVNAIIDDLQVLGLVAP